MGAHGEVACRVVTPGMVTRRMVAHQVVTQGVVAHGMVTHGMVAHQVVARRMVAQQGAAAPCPAGGLVQGHFGAGSRCLVHPLAMTPEIAPKPWC